MSEPTVDAARDSRELGPRRMHPAYLLIGLHRSVRVFLPAIVGVAIFREYRWAYGVLGALMVGYAIASYLTHVYSVTDEGLRVRTGIFLRTSHTVPLSRITAVDTHRDLLHRLFRVWAVDIRTPGDQRSASVTLPALTSASVATLLLALSHGTASPSDSVPPEPTTGPSGAPGGELVARLGNRELLIAAVTGTSIPVIFIGGAAVLNRARDLLGVDPAGWLRREVLGHGTTTVVLLVGGLLVAVLAGIAFTALRLARFTLVRQGDRLQISRGLIAQQVGTVAADRVQAVRVVEGLCRRLLGYCAIEVEVAGLSTEKDSARLLYPLLPTADVPRLLRLALPELDWPSGELSGLPRRARRRFVQVPVLVAGVLTAALALLPGWWALLAVLPLPLGLWIGLGQAADAGWRLDPATVTIRSRRLLARQTVVARRARVQLTQLTTTPFQRPADLAGIRLKFSSRRTAGIRHLPVEDALTLLHRVGRRRPAA